MARADKITQLNKKQEYFSDFLDSFAKHPASNDLARTTNEQSVIQAIKNIINTNFGERPYQPNVGANVRAALFEPNGAFLSERVERSIRDAVDYSEPRASILELRVRETIDGQSIAVEMVIAIGNNPEPISLNFIIKRVR